MSFFPTPDSLERYEDFHRRFITDKDVKENYPKLFDRINASEKIWKSNWNNALITVKSSKGDFFITD